MLFLRSSPVGAKDPTESVAPTVLTLERAEIPGFAPGATYCRRSAASIGCASRIILDSNEATPIFCTTIPSLLVFGKKFDSFVGAVYDRASFVLTRKTRGHRPRLQLKADRSQQRGEAICKIWLSASPR